jgi:SAM-dependent methyltransferase
MNAKNQKSPETIRDRVADDYARAVEAPRSACCPGATAEPCGCAAGAYTTDDLSALPDDAVVNAFGCGNPVALATVKEGEVVVDLGSGAGLDLLLAARRVGAAGRVIGIDMTGQMIDHARRNIEASGLTNVEVRQGLIEQMPVESATVDLVISNCVINLSPEKDRVFAEIARILKPGGRMAVSDIVATDLPQWVRDGAAAYSACIAGAISEGAYVRGLEQAGLTDVEVTDRVVFDADQILALAAGDPSTCSLLDEPRARSIAEAVAGKVWSVSVVGKKSEG